MFVPLCDEGRYIGIDGAWENHGDIRSDISAGGRYGWWRWEEAEFQTSIALVFIYTG